MSLTSLANEYRAEQLRLNREATRRIVASLMLLDLKRIDASAAPWMAEMQRSTATHFGEARGLAAEMYQAIRRESGARGRLELVLPEMDSRKLATSMVVNGPYAAKRMLSQGVPMVDARQAIFRMATGAALRHAQSGGWDTIVNTTRSDERASGWKRITRSGGCRFCRMLADKGAVYYQSSATFAAHRNCSCTAVPVFRGGEEGPEASAMQYLGSRKSRSAKDRARLRDYLDAYYPRVSD